MRKEKRKLSSAVSLCGPFHQNRTRSTSVQYITAAAAAAAENSISPPGRHQFDPHRPRSYHIGYIEPIQKRGFNCCPTIGRLICAKGKKKEKRKMEHIHNRPPQKEKKMSSIIVIHHHFFFLLLYDSTTSNFMVVFLPISRIRRDCLDYVTSSPSSVYSDIHQTVTYGLPTQQNTHKNKGKWAAHVICPYIGLYLCRHDITFPPDHSTARAEIISPNSCCCCCCSPLLHIHFWIAFYVMGCYCRGHI